MNFFFIDKGNVLNWLYKKFVPTFSFSYILISYTPNILIMYFTLCMYYIHWGSIFLLYISFWEFSETPSHFWTFIYKCIVTSIMTVYMLAVGFVRILYIVLLISVKQLIWNEFRTVLSCNYNWYIYDTRYNRIILLLNRV